MNKILTLKHDPILGSSFILIDENETIHPNVELIIPELIEPIDATKMVTETLLEALKNTNQLDATKTVSETLLETLTKEYRK